MSFPVGMLAQSTYYSHLFSLVAPVYSYSALVSVGELKRINTFDYFKHCLYPRRRPQQFVKGNLNFRARKNKPSFSLSGEDTEATPLSGLIKLMKVCLSKDQVKNPLKQWEIFQDL